MAEGFACFHDAHHCSIYLILSVLEYPLSCAGIFLFLEKEKVKELRQTKLYKSRKQTLNLIAELFI